MTTEQIQFITQHIRAKYLWQPVFMRKITEGDVVPPELVTMWPNFLSNYGYLQLRSIEALTDDEAIELAKIINVRTNYGTQPPALIKELLKDYFYKPANQMTGEKWYLIHDYLTQIGIALSHFIILPNGEIFTASVEWQVEQGIIKLTK